MDYYIFLDTNVFLQCRSFIDIDWKSLLTDFKDKDKIFLMVPYIVNKELDKSKYFEKKARNLQKNLRNLKDKEFKNQIYLKISIFPPKWNSLEAEWLDKLDSDEPDCHIIAEILLFKKKNPDSQIYFVTGDNTPYFMAQAIGLSCIYWLDDEYKGIFEPSKPKKKLEKKLTDMKIHFEKNKKNIEINTKIIIPDFETILQNEIPELYLKPDNKVSTRKVDDKSNYSEINDKLSETILEEDSLKDIDKLGVTLKNFAKILKPLLSVRLKDIEEYKRELYDYYEKLEEYKKYKEIRFYLTNTGNIPYTNVNIYINTTLEKDFDIKSKEDLKDPELPKREINFYFPSGYTPYFPKKYNITYSEPQKYEYERNDKWIIEYHIKKIQHNVTLSLYPIMIKYPSNFKTEKIIFNVFFTHDEEGTTKEQKLTIDIKD